ncbi:MAG: TraY domain-containing protein [Rhizobiaceae bacterium]|jgi:RHH-type rel operon transcriptional repressor/antitoxin RelB|nr:TraY domain-containing protein [Rhizobiaceae bacterium]
MIALTLPPEIEARLDALAERTGRSKSDFAHFAVLQFLDDIEDWFLAEDRARALKSGHSTSVPLQTIMERHGLED